MEGWRWKNVLICIPNVSAHNSYYYTICQLVVDRKITVFSMIEKNVPSEIMTMVIIYV